MSKETPNASDHSSSFFDELRLASLPPQEDNLRRVEKFGFWPEKLLKVKKQSASDTLLDFVRAVNRFQNLPGKVSAKNALSHAVTLGHKLAEQLPGDDEGIMHLYKGIALIEHINEPLAEDIARILQGVWDQDKF